MFDETRDVRDKFKCFAVDVLKNNRKCLKDRGASSLAVVFE